MFSLATIIGAAINCAKNLLKPPFLYFVIAGAMLVGAYFYHVRAVEVAYDSGYTKGVDDTKAIAKKQKEAEDRRNEQLRQQERDAQELALLTIQRKLQDAEAKLAKKVQVITKEVTKYVTQKADSECVVTAGFVHVHNLSTTSTPDDVASREPGNVDTPTSVTLSDIAKVDTANNAECQFRAQVIDSWIEWYNRNQAIWEQAVKQQQEAVPSQ
jgi:hypothetical protein